MNNQTLTIIISILTSQIAVVIAQAYLNKKKSNVETTNLKITGEIGVIGMYEKITTQLQKDIDKLQARFDSLEAKFEEMRVEKNRLIETNLEKDILNKGYKLRIEELEKRVVILEEELAKYQHANEKIDIAKDKIHVSVDKAAEEFKSDILK